MPLAVLAQIDQSAVILLAAFGGAVIGGLMSTVGSMYMHRRQVIRDARIKCYDALLPRLRSAVTTARFDAELQEKYTKNPLSHVGDDWNALRRAAAISGVRDTRQLERINGCLNELLPLLNEAGTHVHPRPGGFIPDPDLARRQVPHLLKLEQQIEKYSDWLEKRITWVPWPFKRVPSTYRNRTRGDS